MASIVVVGAGLAGLTCAWRLSRAGHQVEVLEAREQPGGRDVSDDLVPTGIGEPFDQRYDIDLLNLARQLKLCEAGDAGAEPPGDLAILRDGHLAVGRGRGLVGLAVSRAIPPSARIGLLAHGMLSFARASRLRRSRGEWLQRLDDASFLTDAERVAGRDAATLVLGPLAEAVTGCAADELSCVYGVEQGLRWWWPGDRIRVAGGMRRLVEALAEGVAIRRDCEVVAVESETDGARVRYRVRGDERSVLADGVVVAVSALHVPRLCAKLTPDESGFFASVGYAPRVGVHFAVDVPPRFLDDRCLVLPHREGHASGAIAITRPVAGGEAVLSVWSSSATVAGDLDAPDGALVKRALRDLSRMPIGWIAPRNGWVAREPSAIPMFRVGHPSRVARFADRIDRSPRMAFAGEYLVGPGANAAVTSGMRAATSIGRDFDGVRSRG